MNISILRNRIIKNFFGFYPLNTALLAVVCILSLSTSVYSQPLNDKFQQAENLGITGAGYGVGTFKSSKVLLKDATIDVGESVPENFKQAALNDKTIWFKFEIKSRRYINIHLLQRDTLIAQNHVGLVVYQMQGTSLVQSTKFTAINKFGSSGNDCVDTGVYYIQVAANKNALYEVWLDLEVKLPYAPYDEPNPSVFLPIDETERSIDFDPNYCYSINNNESQFLNLPPEFNKSAWIYFKKKKGAHTFLFDLGFFIYDTLPRDTSKYRIYVFDDKVTTLDQNTLINASIPENVFDSDFADQWKISKNYNSCGDTSEYLTLYIVFKENIGFKWPEMTYLLRPDYGIKPANDPDNLPAYAKLGTLSSIQKSFKTQVTCASKIVKPICQSPFNNVLVDSLKRYVSSNVFYKELDTFDLNTFCEFDIPKSGRVTMYLDWIYRNHELFNVKIYKGSVQNNCSQNLVFESEHYMFYTGNYPYLMKTNFVCLDSGKYYIQFLFRMSHALEQEENNFTNTSNGINFELKLDFTPDYDISTIPENSPSKPYKLGNIPSTGGIAINTPTLAFPGTSIPYTIDGIQINNSCLFYTFYVSTSRSMAFSNSTNGTYKVLFKGDCTKGLNTLKRLPKKYGWNDSLSTAEWGIFNSCTNVDTGWYTYIIMHYFPLSPCIYNNSYTTKLSVYDPYYNTTKDYSLPKNAEVINNLNPIKIPTSKTINTVNFSVVAKSDACKDNQLYDFLKDKGCSKLPYEKYSYRFVVFNLDEYSDVRFYINGFGNNLAPYSHENFLLYKGNIIQDTSILKSSNLINSCMLDAQFCGLPKGYYTAVVFFERNDGTGTHVREINMSVDRFQPAIYDHASDALDLGDVSNSNNYVSSPFIPINCNTGAQSTDPPTSHYDASYNPSSIIYPFPGDYAQSQIKEIRRNVWATFTSSDVGDYTLKVSRSVSNTYNNTFIDVYRGSSDGTIDFATLKQMKKVDSVENINLFRLRNQRLSDDIIKFTKTSCSTERFYVIIDKNFYHKENSEVKLEISFAKNSQATPKNSPICKNAIQKTITKQIDTLTANLICLPAESVSVLKDTSCFPGFNRIKHTWFKMDIPAGGPYDLEFNLSLNDFSNNAKVKYRLLFGNCDNIIPGPCSFDGNAFYKLDCMGAGTYFIEVVSDSSVQDEITLTVTKNKSHYGICKPAEFSPPNVAFNYTGCGGDSIHFNNTSSMGKDLVYFWDFGDGNTSTEIHPVHLYSLTNSIDTFYVKLKVTNEVSMLYDSLILPVIVSKGNFSFDFDVSDTTLLCTHVKYKLTAPLKLPFERSFEWLPKAMFTNNTDSIQFVNIYGDTTIRLKMKAVGCESEISKSFSFKRDTIVLKDTSICEGDTIIVKLPQGVKNISWSDGSQDSVKKFFKTENVTVKYTDATGCNVNKKFSINQFNGNNLNIDKKPRKICNGLDALLELPIINGLSYKWSTGATTPSITVTQSGYYSFTISNGKCNYTDSIGVDFVSKGDIPFQMKRIKCPEESLEIHFENMDSVLWKDGIQDTIRYLQNEGSFFYTCYRSGCLYPGEVIVENYRETNILKDIVYFCEDEDTLVLDAGNVSDLLWLPSGYQGRYLSVHDEGWITLVFRNKFGCMDRDSIEAQRKCDPLVYIPNVFTPNGDGNNDLFDIKTWYINEFELFIFNRWGEFMYKSNSAEDRWNGFFNNDWCPEGVYIYMLKVRGAKTNKTMYFKGNITLLR